MRGYPMLLAIGAIVMAGCGGASPAPAMPATEAPPSSEGEPAKGHGVGSEQQPEEQLEAEEPVLQDLPSSVPEAQLTELQLDQIRDVDALFDRFQAAELELSQAAGTCDRACRALRSMNHATERICELASEPDEQSRCSDAKNRYQKARERVRSACRACPAGPALDVEPDAG